MKRETIPAAIAISLGEAVLTEGGDLLEKVKLKINPALQESWAAVCANNETFNNSTCDLSHIKIKEDGDIKGDFTIRTERHQIYVTFFITIGVHIFDNLVAWGKEAEVDIDLADTLLMEAMELVEQMLTKSRVARTPHLPWAVAEPYYRQCALEYFRQRFRDTEEQDYPADLRVTISQYEISRCWGGPEEGGWWYDWYELGDHVERVDFDEVEETIARLTEMYKEDQPRFNRFSMANDGPEILFIAEAKLGENVSKERPHYC